MEERTWALALLFSVDPESGEQTSKFNFAYDMEDPARRHVTDLKLLDTDEGKVLQITFELTDHDQTARIRWDEASGKFIAYKIKPGELLENIMREFLSRDYFSEPIFDEKEGKIIVNVIKNEREFKTWYEDARYNFDDHAKGVAACEIGYEYFLKKYKSSFVIEGDVIIDRTGHNLGDNLYDVFTENKKWISEWKSAYSGEIIYSRLNEAKETLISKLEDTLKRGK